MSHNSRTYGLHGITLCLLVSSTDNLCKEFGPRSRLTECLIRIRISLKLTFWRYSCKNFSKKWFWKKIGRWQKKLTISQAKSLVLAYLNSVVAIIISLDKHFFEWYIVNIFLSISLNICFGCSKEPSHWDGSFECPQYMFWLRNKKINFLVCTLY